MCLALCVSVFSGHTSEDCPFAHCAWATHTSCVSPDAMGACSWVHLLPFPPRMLFPWHVCPLPLLQDMLTCPLWNEVFSDHIDKINNPALKHPLPPSLLSFSPWHWSLIWQHFRAGLSARTWLCTAFYPQCLVRCLLPRKGFVIICWKSDWDCLGSL